MEVERVQQEQEGRTLFFIKIFTHATMCSLGVIMVLSRCNMETPSVLGHLVAGHLMGGGGLVTFCTRLFLRGTV